MSEKIKIGDVVPFKIERTGDVIFLKIIEVIEEGFTVQHDGKKFEIHFIENKN